MIDSLPGLAVGTVAVLLAAAIVLGVLIVASRLVRRTRTERRARLAAPARRLLLEIAAGDVDDDLIDRVAQLDPRVWAAVEPTAVAMLTKVRGEAHAGLVAVFARRGERVRAHRNTAARSAIRRARGAEVLGNLGGADAMTDLCRLLGDASADVRMVAARGLGRIADPAAVAPLLAAVTGRRRIPPQLVAHPVIRIGLAGQPAVDAALAHPDELVRATAVEILGLIGAVGSAPKVVAALRSDPSLEVRVRAARTLGRLGTRTALAPLLESVEPDRPPTLRTAAARALGDLGAIAAAGPLSALLADPQYQVGHHAAQALLRLGPAGGQALEQAAGSGDPDAAAHAREAIGFAAVEAHRRTTLTPVPA